MRLVSSRARPNAGAMENAPAPTEPTTHAVRRDRSRVGYAALGAGGLVLGIWLAWLGAWLLGWNMDELGIRPRDAQGLIGILTAPFAHANFEHLMSNTLPLGLLATAALYAYPRATRFALPLIWLVSGVGVWIWGRPSVHVGISGVVYGLMFFVFFIGLVRKDPLGVTISLLAFFLYGGMVMTVLPHDAETSWEYHLFGAFAGAIAAFTLRHRDPLPPPKRYSWEDDEENLEAADDELEPPAPRDVPVLWQGPTRPRGGDNVIRFPGRDRDRPTIH
jgi:membrane associated rhomboid family serine protease